MQDENTQLRERLGVQSEIVGSSMVMRRITEEIARAASTNAIVLIRGESGVGKELVAPRRPLLQRSRQEHVRLPQLRGAERGPVGLASYSATSAARSPARLTRKIGKFEAADRGTLMLDEIGEMTPGHSGEISPRVGGASVRTRRRQQTDQGRCSRDRGHQPRPGAGRGRRPFPPRPFLPPARARDHRARLAKRVEDIPELAHYFLRKFVEETGRKIDGFTERAMTMLTTYPLARQRPRTEERH